MLSTIRGSWLLSWLGWGRDGGFEQGLCFEMLASI